jgi:hypothetical protein
LGAPQLPAIGGFAPSRTWRFEGLVASAARLAAQRFCATYEIRLFLDSLFGLA